MNTSFYNKYYLYKNKYLKLKQKLIQYAGNNTIEEDIANLTFLSRDASITNEDQRMSIIRNLSVLESIKSSQNIPDLIELCKDQEDSMIRYHCSDKISYLVQRDILDSTYSIIEAIDFITTLQFKNDEINIVRAKLIRIRDTDYSVPGNLEGIISTLDYESNLVVKKYIQELIEQQFPAEDHHSKSGTSLGEAKESKRAL